jgi:hypothetical protein
MFKNAASTNTFITWLARVGGFLLMSFGFMALMRPLSTLGSVVPFIGNIIGMGTGLISFVLAGAISLVVIAILLDRRASCIGHHSPRPRDRCLYLLAEIGG